MSDDPRIIDWGTIERDYRAGIVSVREIARQNDLSEGAIRKRAARDHWDRALAERLQDAVRTQLVRGEVRTQSLEQEELALQDAAGKAVRVILEHRAVTGKMRVTATMLLDRLQAALEADADIEAIIAEEPNGLARLKLKQAVSVHEQARTLDKIANTLQKLVPLERQAFGIDERPQDTAPAPERVRLQQDAYAAVMGLLAERARSAHAVIDGDYRAVGGNEQPALASPGTARP